MATQLKQTDFANPAPTHAANIRVAFAAGPAVLAMRDAVAALPEGTKGATLEELQIAGMAEGLITEARNLLSPPVYAAFLRWGETASHLATKYETDDEGIRRCAETAAAVRALGGTSSLNIHDIMLKSYLFAIEASDSPVFGPLDLGTDTDDDYSIRALTAGLNTDMFGMSKLPRLLDELSKAAWNISDSRLAFAELIGTAITRAFTTARNAPPEPLTDWDQLRAEYEAARAEELRVGAIHAEHETRWIKARGALGAKPEKPDCGPVDPSRPLADIIGDTRTPEYKARWKAYEADLAAWEARYAAAEAEVMGEIEESWQASQRVTDDALNRIRKYPVTSFAALADKATVIQNRFEGELDNDDAVALIRDIQRLAVEQGK